MRFICIEQTELPFMLNLPGGTYAVEVSGSTYALEVHQEYVAVHVADREFVVGPPDGLAQQLGAVYNRALRQPLRTVLRHVTVKEMSEVEVGVATDQDVLGDMQAEIIKESPMQFGGRTDELRAEATRRLDALPPAEMENFRSRSAQLRASKNLPHPKLFLVALNRLIRLYMQRFNDFFVEEVTLHQLAAQWPLSGVFVHIECDGETIDDYAHAGKFPPITRRPWHKHPRDQVDEFKDALKKGVEADSVLLLEVRARALLERGATRSAIIEGSAALDLAVTRKIREGFTKRGKSAAEIDTILKAEIRFKKRANKIMFQATGRRLSEIDSRLYESVLSHRDNYRHGIAHADLEPSQEDAAQAIHDIECLRRIVDGIPV